MTNALQLGGIVKFKVAGQEALPKWAQQAIANALESAEAPPESLRFQCRIATDAKENFREINLKSGETLTLHPRSAPQFGKTSGGEPYLTASMVYSGDGESYKVRWVGDAVPAKMQEVAVKHDKGLGVRGTTVVLDLSRAEITPSWKGKSPHPSQRDYAAENARREGKDKVKGGVTGTPRRSRRCGRLTTADL